MKESTLEIFGPEHLARLDATGYMIGRRDVTFSTVSAFNESLPGSITWLRSSLPDYKNLLNECQASVIVCDSKVEIPSSLQQTKCFFIVQNPKLFFAKLIAAHFKPIKDIGIHPTAILDPGARIGVGVFVGPFATIGCAEIGSGCRIGAFTIVEAGTILGDNVTLHQNVHVGSDGFGFVREPSGSLVKFHHKGHVAIEDGVEIFPFTNVDRATLGRTLIGRNTKIDHYCHIGHNSRVGSETLIAAGSILCGGASVGDRCWIGPNTVIKEKVRVNDNVLIGLSSTVTKNVPSGQTWAGNPACPIDRLKRRQEVLRSLSQPDTR